MAKTAVAELHARLVADVSQYDSEMKRAAAVTQRTASSIDSRMTQLQRSIEKKFSAPDIGRSILTGFGLGSGFAVAQTIVSQVTDHFREQAEYAQQIEQRTARQLDYTKQLIALRQTDDQKLSTSIAERASALAEIERLQRSRVIDLPQWDMRGNAIAPKQIVTAEPKEMRDRMDELTNTVGRLNLEIEKLEAPKRLAAAANELTKFFSELDESSTTMVVSQERLKESSDALDKEVSAYLKNTLDPQLRTEHELRKVQTERGAAIESLAEKYRAMGDPMREYTRMLAQITALENTGALTADDALAARIKVWGDRADAINARGGGSGMGDRKSLDYEIDSAADATVELGGAARDMGFAFSSAFEDAALSASSLGDIVDGLVNDIARMMLRMAIINPIMNSVFGFSGASALPTLWGGARADGGPVSGGTSYLVGEEGPELFTPKGNGTIIPNGAMSGGGRGDSFAFNYNIGAGVTAQQLMPILAMHKRDIIGTIADAKRRRTGLGSALA